MPQQHIQPAAHQDKGCLPAFTSTANLSYQSAVSHINPEMYVQWGFLE